MLILSRKKDESIIIGGNIEVRVLAIEEGRVSIGIEAPRDMEVFREELYRVIQEENMEAAQSKMDVEKMKQFFRTKK